MAGVGPLQPGDPAVGVCSAAGINLLGNQKFKLLQLKSALVNSIQAFEAAGSRDEFLSRGLLTANLIKATCDAFIDMAGSLGDAVGIKGADAVSKGYSGISAFAMTGTQAALGQKADWLGTASTVGKIAISKSRMGDTAKSAAELQMLKVDIINAAVQKDGAKALQITFMEYLPKIGAMSLDHMGHAVKAKWLGAVSAVANAGTSYSKALSDAFDTRLSDIEDNQARRQMLVKARAQMRLVCGKIDEIDALIRQCSPTPGRR